jgi:hypothetical protein
MKRVLLMLDEIVEVAIPPSPYLYGSFDWKWNQFPLDVIFDPICNFHLPSVFVYLVFLQICSTCQSKNWMEILLVKRWYFSLFSKKNNLFGQI